MSEPIRFATLAQAREFLTAVRSRSGVSLERGMPLHQMLLHCAQSIEYSLSGYPAMKPAFLRATLGKLVSGRFLSRGSMKHDLSAPVPGAPKLPDAFELPAAWDRLLQTLDRFEQYEGPMQPHFFFGNLTKEQYGRIHAMHLADHLSVLDEKTQRG